MSCGESRESQAVHVIIAKAYIRRCPLVILVSPGIVASLTACKYNGMIRKTCPRVSIGDTHSLE